MSGEAENGRTLGPEPERDAKPCPACEGRRVKLVLPRRGLVVAPAGEAAELVPQPDECSLCGGSGLESAA